jgi:hypothetical protein
MDNFSTPAVSTQFSRPDLQTTLKRMTTVVGEKGGDPFPILDRIWDIYSGKGIRTVFLSIGSASSALADLEIAEGLGCPLNLVCLNDAEKASWSEVASILKERKREATASPFSTGAETKWILPKNLRVQEALPWWENGTVDLSGTTVNTKKVSECMQSIATAMKLKDNLTRIDILKLDTAASAPGLELSLLPAVMSAGYRPALILVRWSKMPDTELSATLAAGHLQNCGYSLIGKVDNKFLYYFSDEDLYQICSWEEIVGNNPIVTEILAAAKAPMPYRSAPNSSA